MKTGQYPAVKSRLKLFQGEAKQWKADHDQAVECVDLDFELLLQHGISVYEAINDIDENWRARVLSGEIEYLQEDEDFLTKLYHLWLQSGEGALSDLEGFEVGGYDVKYSDDFRRACIEVSGILTSDEKFFSGDDLVAMRDEAIDSHRRGDCEPVEA